MSSSLIHIDIPQRGILRDSDIIGLCSTRDPHEQMISPFVAYNSKVLNGAPAISFGVSSYGYDIRLANEFKIFSNATQSATAYVDPKNFDDSIYVEHTGDSVIIPPGGFVLGRTVEYFRMPRNVTGVVLGKSTYARVGCICLATPLEPGWEGNLVLEFSNGTPRPIKMYANEGCAQIIFHAGDPCATSYANRGGKYQGQTGITVAKV